MKKTSLFILCLSLLTINLLTINALAQTPVGPISGGVVNGKARSLAKPAYPPAAKAVRASGAVNVQVLIDEEGNVVSATAVSGHPLLRAAAEKAASESTFSPTKLQGVAVKVSGVIVYNFIAPVDNSSNKSVSPIVEENIWIVLGMVLEIGIDATGDAEFVDIIDELGTDLPEEYGNEKRFLASFKKATETKRADILQDVINSFNNRLTGKDALQFDLGRNLGKISWQMKNHRENEKFEIDESVLRISLTRIKQIVNNNETEIPSSISDALRKVITYADNPQANAKGILDKFFVEMGSIIETLNPEK